MSNKYIDDIDVPLSEDEENWLADQEENEEEPEEEG